MQYPTAPAGTSLSQLFATLETVGAEYAGAISGGRGGQFYCPNPDHDDENASFDVHVGKNGKAVFTCTPCREAMGQTEFFKVLRSLGIGWAGGATSEEHVDFGEVSAPSTGGGSGGKGVAYTKVTGRYRYRFFDGSNNFEVVRKESEPTDGSKPRKKFSPVRWDEELVEWVGGMGALDNVLRTPLFWERFEDWDRDHIFLVEGEKAATALVKAGFSATCFHGGTAGGRMEGWVDEFRRFRRVIVWSDLDEAGLDWAVRVRNELKAGGVTAYVVVNTDHAWVAKGDAFEQLSAEGGFGYQRVTEALAEKIRDLHPKPGRKVPEKPVFESVTTRPAFPAPSQNPLGFARHYSKDAWDNTRLRYFNMAWWEWNGAFFDKITLDEVRHYVYTYCEHQTERLVARDDSGQFIDRECFPGGGAVSSAVDALRATQIVRKPDIEALYGSLTFRNGWLDIASGEFHPGADPSRFNTWCVQADYTPEAACPGWDAFLESVGWDPGTEEHRALRMWFGYLLSGRTDIEKMMVLVGPRRAGKGTIFGVLEAMLGLGYTGLDVNGLDNTHSLAKFVGKSLAVDADVRFDVLDRKSIPTLLKLSGFDSVTINPKGKDEFTIKLPTRLMFGTNEVPRFADASSAIGGRCITLELTKSFYDNEDFGLKDRVKAEIAGIVNWALEGLRDLEATGFFVEPARSKEIQNEIVLEGSSVRQFVEDCVTFKTGSKVSASDMYQAYESWALRNGYRTPLTNIRFSRELKTAFFEFRNGTTTRNGKKVWMDVFLKVGA